MMIEDCKQFFDFIHQRDPTIVTKWDSQFPAIEEIECPWNEGGVYCIWNQSLLASLERKYIPESNQGPYYRIDSALPVVELIYPSPLQKLWNGRSVLTQGRIYTGVESNKGKAFESWYNGLIRWIRKSFVKNPVPLLGGYLGPAAYQWYKNGGVLLPIFHPPLTPQWLSWLEAQDQHRAVFSK